ncbi:hypothetical protein FB451DRAFT_1192041 [Mycena latifolia]|nr:hypothetical protein FB451DRAFT_1192041 [Mycena latifolia]
MDEDWEGFEICSVCRSRSYTIHKEAREACWDRLPGVYGLPSWEDLQQMKEAAMGAASSVPTGSHLMMEVEGNGRGDFGPYVSFSRLFKQHGAFMLYQYDSGISLPTSGPYRIERPGNP